MPYIIGGIVVLLVGSSLFLLVVTLKRRGVFKSTNRQLDLAIVGLTHQIRRNPKDAQAHVKRGIVRSRKGDLKGAMDDLARSLSLDPTSVEAHYHCALVGERLGNRKLARKEFEWIRQNSEDPFYKTAVANRLTKLKAAR